MRKNSGRSFENVFRTYWRDLQAYSEWQDRSPAIVLKRGIKNEKSAPWSVYVFIYWYSKAICEYIEKEILCERLTQSLIWVYILFTFFSLIVS